MKTFITLLAFIVSTYSISQELYLQVPLDGKKSSKEIENVHLVQGLENDSFVIFAEETKTTYGYLYNVDLVKQANLVSKGLKKKYKEIIGQASSGNMIRLIHKNGKGDKFASILYDFEKKETSEMEYDIELEDQYFLQSFSKDAYCYVFTVHKNSNILSKWTFNVKGEISEEVMDLTSNLKESGATSINLYKNLKGEPGIKGGLTFSGAAPSLTKIENRLPNTLETTTETNKMYAYENSFLWTLDKNKQFTLLLNFSYPTFNPKVYTINKSKPLDKAVDYKTNSYIVDDIIAQVISNDQMMLLEIKDLSTQELIKSYTLKKDDSITFKNSHILQEGSRHKIGTREFEKTSKLLRKMSSDKNGVSIFRTAYGYQLTLGGVRSISKGGGGMMLPGFGGAPTASLGVFSLSFNPAAFAYGSYGSLGSTRIECKFDSQFNHLEGELEENILDHITLVSERMEKKADNVFIKDNKLLFGNYNPNLKSYFLYTFEME